MIQERDYGTRYIVSPLMLNVLIDCLLVLFAGIVYVKTPIHAWQVIIFIAAVRLIISVVVDDVRYQR